ncbi:MAG: LysR substrate-binding domain-containing protein [Bacteroidia bacterium]|nr:LysR substrate-binding domain-containing protein [Bacteroidia bacterium]
MTLQQLEYIIALDSHRHFVKASEACFVSQPNLTMQLRKLEEELGVRIFDRDKKPLQPTEIGRELITRARQILREVRQLQEFVQHEKDALEGEFKIGIIPTLAPYLLPRFLPAFLKAYPQVHLKIQELQTAQIVAQIESGMIDLGLLVTPLREPAIREIPVFYEPFLLYLPENHRFLAQPLLLADELDPSEVLVLDEGHCFREQALAICRRSPGGSSIGFEYQSGSIEALKNLVRRGVGYTLVPELSVEGEPDAGHVRRFAGPEPVREVSIAVHSSFIKEALVQHLRACIQAAVPAAMLERGMVVG